MTARVARLTPPGTGGVAVLAVVGVAAWEIVSSLFRDFRDQSLSNAPPPGELLVGRFGEPPGDEVVLFHRPGMPEPWFEVHCHGGVQVVSWLIEQIEERGARLVPWTELEALAAGSWLRAEAARELTRAVTAKAAAILLDQYHGALEQELRAIVSKLESGLVEQAAERLHELAVRIPFARRLTHPLTVAVCGPPNAGKSSLINAIVGFHRAIVSPIPGTTRDAVAVTTAIDGWPVQFIDTAGIHATADELESAGIARAFESSAEADEVLWVVDRTVAFTAPPDHLSVSAIVANKADQNAAWESSGDDRPLIVVSALTGLGLESIGRHLFRRLPVVSVGVPMPFTSTIAGVIHAAWQALGGGNADSAAALLQSLLQPEQPPPLAP